MPPSPAEPPPSVGVVCVHYRPEFATSTLQALERLRATIPALHVVLVANCAAAATTLKRTLSQKFQWELVEHDNSGLEFGGYQAGVERLFESCDPDWIVIANDTFSTHHTFGSTYRRQMHRELALRHDFPAAFGMMASLRRSFVLEGLRMHRWITTNIFAVNRCAWHAAGKRLYRPELDALVNATGDASKFFAPTIDPVLRQHLESWLFGKHPGLHWYASEPLSDRNAEKMARKARSILQEKYFSALLEAHGTEFIDLKELGRRDRLMRLVEAKMAALRGVS